MDNNFIYDGADYYFHDGKWYEDNGTARVVVTLEYVKQVHNDKQNG